MKSKKTIIAIIQARMGSTRLPGKVMVEIAGKPMLWHVIKRIKQAKHIDNVIVATTSLPEDERVIKFAEEMGVGCYAGSESDVLDRYYQAAQIYGADVIVRATADCPLIDPEVMGNMVECFLAHDFDFVGNTINPTYPDGLDTWVFSFEALQKAWREASLVSDREHVTTYIINNPGLFKNKSYESSVDLSDMRWTVDEDRDLEFVREVYKNLYVENDSAFKMEHVLELIKERPDIDKLNAGIMRDEGLLKSLRNDRVINAEMSGSK